LEIKTMDGVRFTCQAGCTACCQETGFVYLTDDDLRRAAAFVGLDSAEFEAKYAVRTKQELRFRKPRNKQCPFLDDTGCVIHPAKPTQCRLFPFWPELLEDRGEWLSTAARCPGMGKGPLIQIGNALEVAQQMRRAYPNLYGAE
jgi:uncharacterized protein